SSKTVGEYETRYERLKARGELDRCNGAWKPPRAVHMFCIRHIGSNFLREFGNKYLHRLLVNL
ncbi:hypothetical protein PIB30_111961, partial [Stylosanthes scabra]|nr:hypothetical protein [Stylosanthes scabra]